MGGAARSSPYEAGGAPKAAGLGQVIDPMLFKAGMPAPSPGGSSAGPAGCSGGFCGAFGGPCGEVALPPLPALDLSALPAPGSLGLGPGLNLGGPSAPSMPALSKAGQPLRAVEAVSPGGALSAPGVAFPAAAAVAASGADAAIAPAGDPTAGQEEGSKQEGEAKDDAESKEAVAPTQLSEEGYPLRPGMQKCSHFLRSGRCVFGANCRFDHPEGLGGLMAGPRGFGDFPGAPLQEGVKPRRWGEKQCPFFTRSGTCPFGAECRFDHAPPEAEGDDVASSSGGADKGKGAGKGSGWFGAGAKGSIWGTVPASPAKPAVKKDMGLGGQRGKRRPQWQPQPQPKGW
eukprot:TRINITY_DN12718_c1_g1_i1.p1 TRINITY_DN12718_c1_g1~~TRINITY_DN12718_c1_g1_i1.p1  ORF type:complete len:393 (+),score=80.22 TRINITY_DN12718_c1_g1_i1:150-1181(+)